MRKSKHDYGYVVNDDGYQGVITQDTLENVEKSDYSNVIDLSLLKDVPSVQNVALLETVIPDMLDNDLPLPVLNEDGEVEGNLCRSTLVDVLSDQSNVEEEKEDSCA